MKLLRTCLAVMSLSAVIMPQQVCAAPFAKTIEFTQPNGQSIQLWGEGDDFHAVFETLDGYTVVFDAAAKAYCYAELSVDGKRLVSTGALVGRQRPAGIRQHIRIDAETARKRAAVRQNKWEERTGIRKRWEALKAARHAYEARLAYGPTLMAPPETVGLIKGLVLLIDFDADVATIPRGEIEKFCNQKGYNGFGNNGSVRDYFYDVSSGMLTYENFVLSYVRIPTSLHPKGYYTDANRGAGESARELINDAVNILKNDPAFETEIAPLIDQITLGGAMDTALALNVFYAGGNGGVWAQGLWPHKSALFPAIQLTDRTSVLVYQITNMGDALEIGTFCHENGHMICGYPDIYDYDYDSIGGAGKYCIMNSGGHGKNPVMPCAYLRYSSGWTTTVEVEPFTFAEASVASRMEHPDFNKIYRVQKPDVETEYYLFEGRGKFGRDRDIPSEGLFIWHIDELGDRDNQSYEYNDANENYECALVQADGRYDFENNVNDGDATDAWYAENPAPVYKNKFSDETTPSARWWDGGNSAIIVDDISPQSDVMTFSFVPPAPVMLTKSGALPFGREWAEYSYQIGVTVAVGAMRWSVVNGELPPGVSINQDNGVISGLPTQQTNAVFDIEVMTTYNVAVTNSFSLEILPVHRAPFEENFDLRGGQWPDSWTQHSVTQNVSWSIERQRDDSLIVPAHSPTDMAVLHSTDNNDSTTWLITPRIDFGVDARAGRLSFHHFMESWLGVTDELSVYYKSSMDGEWVLLKTYTSRLREWTERVIDLPAVSQEVYIAFAGTARYGYGVCVDTIKVWDPTPPYGFVNSEILPNAIIFEPYETTLRAEGGFEPYTFTVVSNTLPSGITLAPNGTISGTAAVKERAIFEVKVTDVKGNSVVKTYSLVVTEPVVNLFEENFERGGQMPWGWTQEFVAFNTLWTAEPVGYASRPVSAHQGGFMARLFGYGQDLGDGSYETHVTRLISSRINLGQAPENITLYFWHYMEEYPVDDQDGLRVLYKNSAAGEWIELAEFNEDTPQWTERSMILPNPTADYYIAFEGSARFGYGVCIDSIRITDESLAPVITTDRTLSDGLIGFEYEVQLEALGGLQPYTWTLAEGVLPDGVTLSADGLLSGTPLKEYFDDFQVEVVGFDGRSSINGFSLKIRSVPGVPFFEDFEKDGEMPRGWTQAIMNGNTSWSVATGTASPSNSREPRSAHSGSYNASLYCNGSKQSPAITRLITPMLDLGGGVTNAVLSFRHYMAKWLSDQDFLKVWSRATLDGPWTLLAEYRSNTPAWTERTVALVNVSSTFFIAFESYGQYGHGICIDDVSIDGDAPDPYGDWLADNFSALEIDSGVDTGYFSDPDGDGIDNVWEYAHLLDPGVYNHSGTPTGGVSEARLQLIYRQNKSAVDLTFVVEACTNLLLGDWSTNDISEFKRLDQGAWWEVTAQHDVPVTNAPSRFMRLKLIID